MSAFLTVILPVVACFLRSFSNPVTVVTRFCVPPGQLFNFNYYLVNNRPTLVRHLRGLHELNEEDEDDHHVLVILDLSCRGTIPQLIQSNRKLNFNYRWLLVNTPDVNSTKEKTLSVFANISILHSSQIYFLDYKDHKDIFEINRFYRNSMNTGLIIEPILKGSLSTGTFNWTRSDSSFVAVRMRFGLEHALVRAAIVITDNDTTNHLRYYKDVHIDTNSKLNFRLTEELIRFLNATVEYHMTQNYGYPDNATGEYGGIIGMLNRSEVDITSSAWFFNLWRFSQLAYISMTTQSRFKLLFISPNLSVTDNVFVLPFQWVRKWRGSE